MSAWELGFILLLILVALLWQQKLRVREIAVAAGRRACQKSGVAFLDDTVVLQQTRVRRGSNGRLALTRRFHFEFATDGQVRFDGAVIMQGYRVCEVVLDPTALQAPRTPIDVDTAQLPLDRPHE
ncbi:MAG TPA: DUF3301 domain-containing protein [Gammaproteobacteria bacterium]|nr:DUF3301 domain-containing protein [Gammaproteobacteria bacterium]